MTTMANYWVERGWQISLLTLVGRQQVPFYPLSPVVRYRPLDVAAASGNAVNAFVHNVRRLLVLRSAIRRSRADVLISFTDRTNVLVLLATTAMRLPVVVSERIDPHHHQIGPMWEVLRRWTYRHARCVVAQTERALRYFPVDIRARSALVPNPVPQPPQLRPQKQDNAGGRHVVMGMGRLVEQKGFDLLIQAFGEVSTRHPDWTLEIPGEGPERLKLEGLMATLGLSDRVRLPGVTRRPYDALSRADLFVLSSRYEGFPNVLCEAMACGVPVVSFDCPSGPREVIRDGIDGVLVPSGDTSELARAMDMLMNDRGRREQLGREATQITARFSLERVMTTWEELLQRLVR